MTPLRVLIVSHSCVVDANQTLYRWVEQLPDVALHLIAPATWNTDLRGTLAFERLAALRCGVTTLPAVFSGRGSLHFYIGAAKCVRQFQPDLIFLDEEPWSLCALQFMLLARSARARVVFYTKENLHRRYPLPFRLIERMMLRSTAAAAVISAETAAVLRAKGYRGPSYTLPHGFEPEWFHPVASAERRLALGLEGTVIGYVGRLAAEKGVGDLIEAFARLRAGVSEPTGLLIIGSGPQEAELRRAVTTAGLDNVVKFIPAIAHNEIAEYYSCIDVLVVPSRTTARWKEQFGRVLVEAMACGVCVVGSDSGEIPAVIGGAGLVFAEGDVGALTERLRAVTIDPQLRTRLAEQGRQRAMEAYSHPVVAEQLVALWRAAMEQGHVAH
jgi:glycosyltransferase involved in cell wall biosynthesis